MAVRSRRADSMPSRIAFFQSGGVVGALRSCEVMESELTPPARAGLVVLRRRSSPGQTLARDAVAYRLTISQGSKAETLRFDDRSLPPRARPLIRFLAARARPAFIGEA